MLRRTSMKSWYALDTSSISTAAAFRRVAISDAAVIRWMAYRSDVSAPILVSSSLASSARQGRDVWRALASRGACGCTNLTRLSVQIWIPPFAAP